MSIKICVITPVSHLKTYGNMGEMDMSLSHLILEDPDGPYVQYYKAQREKGRFVILDNSAFELEQQGKGLDPDPVLDAAEITGPSEVIATDVLFNGEATFESTKRFIARMKERGLLGRYQIMAVPQGKSKDEWLQCYVNLRNLDEVTTIGLSKLSVPMSFLGNKNSPGNCARSRLVCTDLLDRKFSHLGTLEEPQIHLLGGDNWAVWEMGFQKRYPWIRSNDSSCAVWYGRYLKTFNEEGKIEDIVMEKPDLENRIPGTEKVLSRDNVKACIMENVARWHQACK